MWLVIGPYFASLSDKGIYLVGHSAGIGHRRRRGAERLAEGVVALALPALRDIRDVQDAQVLRRPWMALSSCVPAHQDSHPSGSHTYLCRLSPAARVIGGGGEIRTHGPLRVAGFQDRCLKPLGHPSLAHKDNRKLWLALTMRCRRLWNASIGEWAATGQKLPFTSLNVAFEPTRGPRERDRGPVEGRVMFVQKSERLA